MMGALVTLVFPLLGSALAGEIPDLPPPPTPIAEERLLLDGYLRTRGAFVYNGDLNRGPTPTTGEPIFPLSPTDGETLTAWDIRLRLDATYVIVSEIKVHARVDGLDNTLLGSTPAGFPASVWVPSIYASTSQAAPEAGSNAFSDSIRLKRAWGEATTPFGSFMVGRMGMPMWGLGILANPGDGLDQDFDEDVDRIGFLTTLADHLVGVAWDWNAVGPTTASPSGSLWGQDYDLTDEDDVHTLSASVLRYLDDNSITRRLDAGQPAFTWGTWVTWRRQALDVPSYWLDGIAAQDGTLDENALVERDFRALGVDLTAALETPRFSLAAEAVFFTGSVGNLSLLEGVAVDEVSMDQQAAVIRGAWKALPEGRLEVGMEAGFASGDDAPGFGVASALDQSSGQAGDMDAPQFSMPDDKTVDNFRFSPNYHVDLILWRSLVGTVTDAIYLKPHVRWRPHPRLLGELSIIHSRAVEASSTPGGVAELGTELDLALDWQIWHGFQGRADYGVLLPGAGFRNTAHGLEPDVAQAGRLLLAFVF